MENTRWDIAKVATRAEQPDDPRPAMTVAARAANIVEGNADRRVGVAALHGQIEINDRAARLTRDDEHL